MIDETDEAKPGLHTKRGCFEDLAEACTGANCKLCTAEKCNVDVLGDRKKTCQTCLGADCTTPKSAACEILSADDKTPNACVTVFGSSEFFFYHITNHTCILKT